MTTSFFCEHLTVDYHHKAAILDVSLEIKAGRKVAVIGPNGAGKTTLLKAALGLAQPLHGQILFFGQPYSKVREKIAYVPQKETVDWDFPITVLEVVVMGRFHQLGLFKWVRQADKKAALDALKAVGIEHLADKKLSELSGGQQQRVFIARALIQDADLYLLDEPFSAIDAATERMLVELFDQLAKKGKTILVVHHDLNSVKTVFNDVILLNQRVIAFGDVEDVFTAENIAKTFGKKEEIFAEVIRELSKKTTGTLF